MDDIIDFDSLTERQRDALGLIAINHNPAAGSKTLQALVSRGLLEEVERVLPGRLPVTIKDYTMPPWVHIQWCEWCSRTCPSDE